MKNKATVIKDRNNNVYLKVEGKPLDAPVYFKIESYNSTVNGKLTKLSKSFLIDLKAKEE